MGGLYTKLESIAFAALDEYFAPCGALVLEDSLSSFVQRPPHTPSVNGALVRKDSLNRNS